MSEASSASALPCTCGAPAIVEDRPGLKFRFVVRCSLREEGRGRAGTDGCTQLPRISGRWLLSAVNSWNNEVRGCCPQRRMVVKILDGKRCPVCGLLQPHSCLDRVESFTHNGSQDCASGGLRKALL